MFIFVDSLFLHIFHCCRHISVGYILIYFSSFAVGADFMKFSPRDLYPTRYIPKTRIILPINLRKMEINAATAAWRLTSYIRAGSQSGESHEFISALKLAKGRKAIISVQATHTIEGRFPQNIIIKNVATGKLPVEFSYLCQ